MRLSLKDIYREHVSQCQPRTSTIRLNQCHLPFRLILSILIKVAILEQGFVVCCGVVPPHAVHCGPRKIAEFHRFHMRRKLTAGLCFWRADINNRQLWTRRRR